MSLSKLSVLPLFKPESEPLPTEECVSSVPGVKRKRGAGHVYTKLSTFDCREEAEHHVKSQNTWYRESRTTTEEGDKDYYKCNQGQAKVSPCPVTMYLLFHSTNGKVSMYFNEAQHVHQQTSNLSARGVTKQQKEVIVKLLEDGVNKPKAILSAFQARNLNPPSTVKLNRFLVNYRKKKYGNATINVNDLLKWCEDRVDIPVNVDEPFVLAHSIKIDQKANTNELGIFMTTLRLLKIATRTPLLQTDSTYKLNWQGYPVLIVGTSDQDRAFHPFGLALCYSEKESDFEFIFKSVASQVANSST